MLNQEKLVTLVSSATAHSHDESAHFWESLSQLLDTKGLKVEGKINLNAEIDAMPIAYSLALHEQTAIFRKLIILPNTLPVCIDWSDPRISLSVGWTLLRPENNNSSNYIDFFKALVDIGARVDFNQIYVSFNVPLISVLAYDPEGRKFVLDLVASEEHVAKIDLDALNLIQYFMTSPERHAFLEKIIANNRAKLTLNSLHQIVKEIISAALARGYLVELELNLLTRLFEKYIAQNGTDPKLPENASDPELNLYDPMLGQGLYNLILGQVYLSRRINGTAKSAEDKINIEYIAKGIKYLLTITPCQDQLHEQIYKQAQNVLAHALPNIPVSEEKLCLKILDMFAEKDKTISCIIKTNTRHSVRNCFKYLILQCAINSGDAKLYSNLILETMDNQDELEAENKELRAKLAIANAATATTTATTFATVTSSATAEETSSHTTDDKKEVCTNISTSRHVLLNQSTQKSQQPLECGQVSSNNDTGHKQVPGGV